MSELLGHMDELEAWAIQLAEGAFGTFYQDYVAYQAWTEFINRLKAELKKEASEKRGEVK